MTDKEIIKALGCCDSYFDCDECPCQDVCGGLDDLSANTLDLINRQKAEIEKLKLRNGLLTSERELHKIGASKLVLKHRAEAIKGFADELKKRYCVANKFIRDINNLVKEMVGDAE